MFKDLPIDYEPKTGDLRSESLLDDSHTFHLDMYADGAWIALHSISGNELETITGQMEHQGRKLHEETGRLAYYWRTEQVGQSAPVWWANQKTGHNAAWRAPRYGLGELVWHRWRPLERPKLITGLSLVPMYHDESGFFGEEEGLSSPQGWLYRLNNGEEEEEEDRLVERAELAALLTVKAAAVLTPAGENVDPFLDADNDFSGRMLP